MSKGETSRTILTSALGALALTAGLAMGAARAHAADAKPASAHAADAKPASAVAAGRELFNTWSCGACHTLSDAGASGAVGPSLDNPKLTHDAIVERIQMGGGPMPAFGGQISDADIGKLADYIVAVNHKAATQTANK